MTYQGNDAFPAADISFGYRDFSPLTARTPETDGLSKI